MATPVIHRFENKVAVITGSTEGIGFAIAKRIAAEGGSVCISSRHQDKVNHAVQQLHDQGYTKVLGMVCDVSKDSDQHNLIQATVDQFGGIDILVCNAAVAFGGPVTQISDSKWDKAFQVNVKSTFILTKAVLPYMKQRNGSNIVLISSIWDYNPSPMAGTYGVTKTTLFGMTSELSQELGQFNIRVNCVAPGVIETAMSTLLRQGGDENPYLKNSPLHRFGQADEVASAVAYVASDEASFVTGSTIVVDGGILRRL